MLRAITAYSMAAAQAVFWFSEKLIKKETSGPKSNACVVRDVLRLVLAWTVRRTLVCGLCEPPGEHPCGGRRVCGV